MFLTLSDVMKDNCLLESLSKGGALVVQKMQPLQYAEDASFPNYALFLDTETTGLNVFEDKILSIAGILVGYDDNLNLCEPVDYFYFLNSFDGDIDQRVQRITGLTKEKLNGHKIGIEKRQVINSFMQKAGVFIAHNANFDYSVLLNNEFLETKHARDSRNWYDTVSDINWEDDHKITSHKLEYLCYLHGFYYDAHDAYQDTAALFSVVKQKSYFRELLNNKRNAVQVIICGTNYHEKDIITGLGYRWDGSLRHWKKRINKLCVDEEVEKVKNALTKCQTSVVEI